MKFNKSNIVYIDFLFKRKKLESKPMIFLYKIYSTLRHRLFFSSSSNNNKSSNYFKNHKSSNY